MNLASMEGRTRVVVLILDTKIDRHEVPDNVIVYLWVMCAYSFCGDDIDQLAVQKAYSSIDDGSSTTYLRMRQWKATAKWVVVRAVPLYSPKAMLGGALA